MHGNLLKPWPSCTRKQKVYGAIRVPFLTYSSTCRDSRVTWWWRHPLSSDGGQTVHFSEPQFPWMKLGKSYLFSRSGACVPHRQGLRGAPHLLFLERALQVVSGCDPESQHARPPCPSPTPRACSNSCPPRDPCLPWRGILGPGHTPR